MICNGSHVKFAYFVLLAVSEEPKTLDVQCLTKQLLDSLFVISLSHRRRLITLTSTLIILVITKTSSNSYLESVHTFKDLVCFERHTQTVNTSFSFRVASDGVFVQLSLLLLVISVN